MATLEYQIVRPDSLLHEGLATSVVIVTPSGELGILPGHAQEICTLGDGIIRVEHEPNETGATRTRVVVKGGYAEITPTSVIVLADHARDLDDIYPETVQKTKEEAVAARSKLGTKDTRRAYYDSKIAWCDLLLKANEEQVRR